MKFFPIVNGTCSIWGKIIAYSRVNCKGEIDVVSNRNKRKFWGVDIPFVRGLAILFLGIYIFLVSLRNNLICEKPVNFNEKSEKKLEKTQKKHKNSKIIVFLTALGLILAFVFFVSMFIVPYFMFSVFQESGMGKYLTAFVVGLIRLAFLVMALLCLRFVPSIRQFYRNNAAGNLAYSNFANKKIDSFYLSTNFLNFVVCGFLLSIFVISFVVVEINFVFKFLLNLLLVVLCFSLVYELLKLLEFKNNLFAKLIVYPVAFLTAEKPSQTEREIAFSAMNEVKLMQENEERIIGDVKTNSVAFSVVYSEVKQHLSSAGIEDDSEVDWLIAMALKKNRSEVKLLTHVSKEEYKRIKNALSKREKRMPISKIFNTANFYGREFYVDKNVLSPRGDTELVVEEAIKEIKKVKKAPRVLDLMTGSGAIAVTVALETNSVVYATDISKTALEVAKRNAKEHGAKIKFVESDIFKGLKKEKFDVIISNPPYIPTKDILALDDEVKKYDPTIALDGGEDGLYFYREIAQASPQFLKENGVLVLEIGYNQGESVKKVLQNNFKNIRIKKDYGGNNRIVVATKK